MLNHSAAKNLEDTLHALTDDSLLIVLHDQKEIPETLPGFEPLKQAGQTYPELSYNLYSHTSGKVVAFISLNLATDLSSVRWRMHKVVSKIFSIFSHPSLTIHAPLHHPIFERIVEDITAIESDHLYYTHTRKVEVKWESGNAKAVAAQASRINETLSYKRWINSEPDFFTSLRMGEEISSYCKGKDQLTFRELDKTSLEEEKLHLLLLVGRGSHTSPPRLYHVQYRPDERETPTYSLIGKGITFDTGGINVKPYEAYVSTMRNDMGGAALVWHIFKSLVEGGYRDPIDIFIPTCENAIGPDSVKPGTIVTTRDGQKVMIDHTDAEGRLILADAIMYCQSKYPTTKIYTIATLTTAALLQYGPFSTPVHFMPPGEQEKLTQHGRQNGEDFSFCDARPWYTEANRLYGSFLTNRGGFAKAANMSGKSNIAAHFLKSFTHTEYTHFDIFNTVWNWSGEYPGHQYGATGAPFATLLDFFKSYH